MPRYTTSYATKAKPKPRYRKVTGSQLPSGRRRQQQRKNAQYLRRTQGFGGGRCGGRGGRGANDRRIYALIVVGCAFLLFVASIVWYANRSVDITLNGETAQVRIHSTIEQVMAEQELSPKPGDLLAVDGEVLKKDAGSPCTVTLEGKRVDPGKLAQVELEGGEELTVGDGEDVYEEHDVDATVIEPALSVKGTGPVRFVETWGEEGRSEVWTGHESGKVANKGVVKESVDAVVTCASVSPARKQGKKYVALTFDEGPSSRTRELLGILAEKGARGTFFISGDKASQNAATLKAIAASGNELGSNGFADVDLTELSAGDMREQIARGFDEIEDAAGARVRLLRPPFGAFSEENWAAGMDLVGAVVTWNVDSGDWLLEGADAVVANVMGSVGNGDVILLTDNDATADQLVEALPTLIDSLQAEGYELVTVTELIATDENLGKLVDTGRTGLPKGAVLPRVADSAGE